MATASRYRREISLATRCFNPRPESIVRKKQVFCGAGCREQQLSAMKRNQTDETSSCHHGKGATRNAEEARVGSARMDEIMSAH